MCCIKHRIIKFYIKSQKKISKVPILIHFKISMIWPNVLAFFYYINTARLTMSSMKATVENPRGSVEKLSPKESVKGGDTVLLGSWGLPRDFPRANPSVCPRKISEGIIKLPEALSWRTVIPFWPKDFQQLLRQPNSWGLLANEASLHTVL